MVFPLIGSTLICIRVKSSWPSKAIYYGKRNNLYSVGLLANQIFKFLINLEFVAVDKAKSSSSLIIQASLFDSYLKSMLIRRFCCRIFTLITILLISQQPKLHGWQRWLDRSEMNWTRVAYTTFFYYTK